MDNNDFLKDWLEGKVSREELNIKKAQGNTVVRDFDELITRSSRLQVPENISKEDSWRKLSEKLAERPEQEAKVVKMNRWIPMSIAASVILLIVALFAFSSVTVQTQLAETKVEVLPDGSEVTLNADSKITYKRFGWSGDRKVTLEGEAFFNVKKGDQFTVDTDHGIVSVLGTSFNVNDRDATFEVACYTGKVMVGSKGKEVILTKGLSTKLLNNSLTDANSFDTAEGNWRSGDFYFESKPLSVVINELERQFDVEIVFPGDAARIYTGYFSNKNLDEALTMVFKPMSLNYEKQNNKIIIK